MRIRSCTWWSFFFTAIMYSLGIAGEISREAGGSLKPLDRSRLPAALRNVPLERLSSGALMRLDRDGDLVESPDAQSTRKAAMSSLRVLLKPALVGLDPRVAPNIRLGDDPAPLPASLRAQAEPHIARAPAEPDFLVATFQEGRFTTGGAVDCGYSISHDGGLTWTRSLIPHLSSASGGSYDRATDPVAAVDVNGIAYLNTLGLRNGTVSDGRIVVTFTLFSPSSGFRVGKDRAFHRKKGYGFGS